MVGAYLSVLLWVAVRPSLVLLLLVLLALPKAISIIRLITRGRDRAALNQALRGSALLHLQFGVFLALGLLASRLITS